MNTTNPALDWAEIEFDHSDVAASAIFANVLVADIGFDDAYWVSPILGTDGFARSWTLEHNTRELGRYATRERAKAAAQDHFATLV